MKTANFTLTPGLLHRIDAYHLSVGQIFLFDNPLPPAV